MKEKLKNIGKSEFTRNVAVMFSGNTLAIFLPFFFAPLISRLYTPEDFAGFELFFKIVTLIALVGSLRFDLAILLPKEQSESNQLVKLCFRILFYFTLFSAIAVLFFRDWAGEILKNDQLPNLLYWLPLGVFLTGSINILNQLMTRFRKYNMLATNKIVGAIGNNLSKYLIGFSSPSSFGLVLGQFAGLIGQAGMLFKTQTARKVLFAKEEYALSRRQLIKKYKDFPLVNSVHVFVDETGKTLLFFGISAYYGEIIIGLFAFTFRYLKGPVQVLGSSLAQVLNERMASMYTQGLSLRPLFLKIVLVLSSIGIVPFSALFLYGEPIFAFIFGDVWSEAGLYAELMAPWLFFNFITSPISMLPIIARKQKAYFVIGLILNVLFLLVLFVIAGYGYPIKDLIMLISASQVIMHVIVLVWFYKIAKNSKSDTIIH